MVEMKYFGYTIVNKTLLKFLSPISFYFFNMTPSKFKITSVTALCLQSIFIGCALYTKPTASGRVCC